LPLVASAKRPDSERKHAGGRMYFVAAPVNLNHPGHYVHWGVIQLSVANLVVIGIMVVLFAAALLLPFPKGRDRR
jgi:hypothetical protein